MSYADLVRKHIEASGMTLEEIAAACKSRGLDIHPTYISKLRNGTRPAPTDENITRMLAEVTGGDAEELIFEGYIERAPEPVRRYLEVVDPALWISLKEESGVSYEDLISKLSTEGLPTDEHKKLLGIWETKPSVEDVRGRADEFPILSSMPDDWLEDVLSSVYKKTSDLILLLTKEPNIIRADRRQKLIDAFPEPWRTVLFRLWDLEREHFLKDRPPAADQVPESPAPYLANAHPVELVPIPRYGEIHAADPMPAEDRIVGYDWYPAEQIRGGEFFTLIVRGDCMDGGKTPILPGHVVLVRKQPEVENGNIAVVWWNGEDAGHLRRVYYRDGKIMLVADNPTYPPELLAPEKVTVIGKVVEVKFEPGAAGE